HVVGGGQQHPARELVAVQPAVAVGPAVLGRDDVGRVAGDQVEAFAPDRLEEAAEAHFDVGKVVQRRVQLREGERARIDVGGDDVRGVPRGEQCLQAASGGDVEDAHTA